jgi:hypothetical protein
MMSLKTVKTVIDFKWEMGRGEEREMARETEMGRKIWGEGAMEIAEGIEIKR